MRLRPLHQRLAVPSLVFLAALAAPPAAAQADWRLSGTSAAPGIGGRCVWFPPAGELITSQGSTPSGDLAFAAFDGNATRALPSIPSPGGPGGLNSLSVSGLAYDPAQQQVVALVSNRVMSGPGGGSSGPPTTTSYFLRFWIWNGSAWSGQPPGPGGGPGGFGSPVPPIRAVLSSPDGDGVVLLEDTPQASTLLAARYRFSGGTVARQAFSTPIPDTLGCVATTNLRDGYSLLFGGSRFSAQGIAIQVDETWRLDGTTWTQLSPPVSPEPRAFSSLVYDDARDRFVLFGGLRQAPQQIEADTWEFDGTTWRELNTPTIPPRRTDEAMGYLAGSQEVVMFGGRDIAPGVPILNDLWTFATPNPAAVSPLGIGCAGSQGVPELTALDGRLPWAGDAFQLLLRNVPTTSSLAIVATGGSTTSWAGGSLPQDLGPILGLQGCTLFTSIDEVRAMPLTGGEGTLGYFVPLSAPLVGATFHTQALVFDPGVTGPFPGAVSNALSARIGRR